MGWLGRHGGVGFFQEEFLGLVALDGASKREIIGGVVVGNLSG
jgi:hypothetical protein